MQDTNTYQIHIGAVGWNPDNARGFYPDDLPPEWRLAYYNNFFSCVYLPYAVWGHADAGMIRAWLDESLSRFRFVLEVPADKQVAGLSEKLAMFGERLGYLDDTGANSGQVLWLEDFPTPLTVVQRARELAAHNKQIFIISRSANFPAMEQVAEQLEAQHL